MNVRFAWPTQRFGHGLPHRDDNRRKHQLIAGGCQRLGVIIAALPLLIEQRDVGARRRAKHHGLVFTVDDSRHGFARANRFAGYVNALATFRGGVTGVEARDLFVEPGLFFRFHTESALRHCRRRRAWPWAALNQLARALNHPVHPCHIPPAPLRPTLFVESSNGIVTLGFAPSPDVTELSHKCIVLLHWLRRWAALNQP